MEWVTSNLWWIGPAALAVIVGIVRLTKTKRDDEVLDKVKESFPDAPWPKE